ncbi:MAG: hypothetical protein QOI98_2972, partial [Solirubrobacteraceae bacterium]|nr:hypothetical protein [Solirubrobacteraceae bacterium]
MTADHQLAVRNLVHRYADAVCRRDDAQWASCWAPDGQWDLFSRSLQGLGDVMAFYRRAMARYDAVVQLVHNGVVNIANESGLGCWYITEHAWQAQTGSLLIGRYDDAYIRIDGSWLF